MRKKVIWGGVLAVLVAAPAVLGLVLVGGGDDSSSRRSAALVQVGTGGGYELVVSGLTPSGEAADVLSYSWGASNNATYSATSGGYTTGKAQFESLQITKKVDIASPNFGKAVAMGTNYPTATLTLYSGGTEKPSAYMIYTMTDVIITGVQHSGNANDVPTEQVSLNYAKLQVTHKELADGAVKRQTLFTYDLSTAKAG